MNYLIIEIIISFIFIFISHIIIKLKTNITFDYIKKNPLIIAIYIVLLIGFMVRVVGIEKYPMVQDTDEINIGYDIYALANYGVDKYAMNLPVHLLGRGSGQNALYVYLSLLFVKGFGLTLFSTRLLNSVISCISLCFILYLFNKSDVKDNRIKLFILFMAAIFPWHICKARWGLESNILPDLIFYGMSFIYLAIKEKKKRYYYASSVIFGLSMYAYGPSYVYLPVTLLITFIYLLIKKHIKFKTLIINILLIIIIQIPIISFIYINNIHGDTYKFLNTFTIPKLYSNRIQDKSNVGKKDKSRSLIVNFKDSFNIIINQEDSRPINTVKDYGLYYKYSLPFIIIGILLAFRSKHSFMHLNIIAFIGALLLSACLEPNINRINVTWIPIYIFLIYGIVNIYKESNNIGLIIVGVYVIQFVSFTNFYMNGYQNVLKQYQSHEILQILEKTKEYQYDSLYITEGIGENQTYYLFTYQPNPYDWNDNVIKKGGIKDYDYLQYKNVYFYLPEEIDEDNNVYIVTYGDFKRLNIKNKKIKYYENYLLLY